MKRRWCASIKILIYKNLFVCPRACLGMLMLGTRMRAVVSLLEAFHRQPKIVVGSNCDHDRGRTGPARTKRKWNSLITPDGAIRPIASPLATTPSGLELRWNCAREFSGLNRRAFG
jgi:hypothetical protein